ncbi:hypothetical protein S7711_10213 [Stachybotrys chartarum IBT 7711]|uniref:Uncharacterized protein n=1 Tax=Stachybotrys chartarum (strain CBS 109288 / IBT 7711) TaxID=1280523 RepID=A0A084AZS2_STACB|nr:hypothetical protein S7711_10213 [Stachybotrys chartarum IBT 7711]
MVQRQGNVTLRGGESFDGPVLPYAHPNPDIVDGSTWRHPHERFGTSELVAVMAYKVLDDEIINRTVGALTYTSHAIQFDPSTYVDLNSLVQDGQLAWTAPDGGDMWSTLGGHHSESFIGNSSWTTDKFNKAGAELTTSFWDTYLLNDEEVAAMIRDVVGHAWEDSLEPLATLHWTHGILDRLEQRNGYSLGFPLYFEEFSFANCNTNANSDDLTNVDYRAVLNDGYQEYIQHFLNWTKAIWVKFRHQPAYNLPLEMPSGIPLLDTPEGESFGFGSSYESFREFVASAHQSGQKVISSELGASSNPAYSQTIPALLNVVKRSIAGGFSQHVLHGFPYSDLLGLGFTYGCTALDDLLLPDAFNENGTIFLDGPAYKALVFYREDARLVTLSATEKLTQLAVGLDCATDMVCQTHRSDVEAGVGYVYILCADADSTQCFARLDEGDAGASYVYNAWTGDQSPLPSSKLSSWKNLCGGRYLRPNAHLQPTEWDTRDEDWHAPEDSRFEVRTNIWRGSL